VSNQIIRFDEMSVSQQCRRWVRVSQTFCDGAH
jgi:hypothetical protein